MHAYPAVVDGSDAAPAPVVLVGKGLTFDSGGISIKPGAAMGEMKYDMAGAASVLGVFRAIGALKLDLNVVGIVAACENMPSGRSVRPGDVVTSMSGLTIEVLNTGARVVALGHHNSGLFTRADPAHERLAAQLLAASAESGDHAWRTGCRGQDGPQAQPGRAGSGRRRRQGHRRRR